MPVTVVCPKCGFENKSVGVFCTRCGCRMGMDGPTTKVTREPLHIGRAVSFVVRSAVILGLVGAIALLAWPLPLTPVTPDRRHAEEFTTWLQKVEETLRQGGGGVYKGIRQEAVNNYIAAHIALTTAQQNESWSMNMTLQQFQIFIEPAAIRAIAVGAVGPLDLSFEVAGTPVTGRGHFALNLSEARIGHLQMPGFARSFVAGKLAAIVADMEREKFVLDHVKRIELSEGRADLQVGK